MRTPRTAPEPRGPAVGAGARPPTPWLEQVEGSGVVLAPRPPRRAAVAVVGAGVIGASVALHLARMGAAPLLLEARAPAWGASGRNAGLVLGSPASLAALAALLDEEGIDADFRETAHLALASGPASLERMRREVDARPPGAAPVEVIGREACEAAIGLALAPRFPGGRWMPRAAVVHPARLVHGLAAAAARHGAALARARVVGFARARDGSGVEVRTDGGTVRAGALVLACNARAAALAPALACMLAPARGQALATRPLAARMRVALAVDYGAAYWRQTDDGSVVLGGLQHLDPQAEATGRAALNPRIQAALAAFLPQVFPGLGPVRVARRWAGIMDVTPDGRPLLGGVPGAPGAWVAAGFGGHGLPPALVAGRALAAAVCGDEMPEGMRGLDPARFAEGAPC